MTTRSAFLVAMIVSCVSQQSSAMDFWRNCSTRINKMRTSLNIRWQQQMVNLQQRLHEAHHPTRLAWQMHTQQAPKSQDTVKQ